MKRGEAIFDEIRAEIKMYEADCRLQGDTDECEKCNSNVFGSVYRIINKYKAAEELRMEKHTEKQIYDGCIHLMQKMVDYFQEYIEYLGYDLDKLDEDERFAVEMSNMEIVRKLFLLNTRNSGGCSIRDFCEKLGVDPYEGVKFEFEEGEE